MGKVSAEYTRLSMEIAVAQMFGRREEEARLRLRQQVEVTMGDINDKFAEAKAKLTGGVGGAMSALAVLEAEREKLPSAFFDSERVRIVREARSADRDAMDAVADYQRAALAEARKLRAEAEASVDPAIRLADITERKTLAESALDASALAERAAEMLEAGQPKRATLYLDAAEDKGGRMAVLGIREAVEAALDEHVPERAKALVIESDTLANVSAFRAARLRQLYDSRLGLRQTDKDTPGEIGTGNGGEVAQASLAAKVEAWVSAQRTGEAYVDPVPQTSLPSLDHPVE